MKKIIATIIMASGISIIGFSDISTAGEAVFCVSEEDRYVVLINSGDKCMEEETELKVSGAGVIITDGIIPLADFSVNDACPEEALGTRTDVGLDYNRNGKLEPGEILSTSSYCKSMSADADSDMENAEALSME
jgi:hypothetical protein